MSVQRKRIGIMGGSYNPVHAGHMIVASYIAQWGVLDEVWLTLSPQNPFKRNLNLADDAHRLEMLRIAVGVTCGEAPQVELSSTFIRDAIAAGRDMNFFLPPGVYQYIIENGLYGSVQ